MKILINIVAKIDEKVKETKFQNLDFLPGESEGKNEDDNNNKILSKDKYMYCSSDPEEPYICKNCGYKLCENCSLKQYEQK